MLQKRNVDELVQHFSCCTPDGFIVEVEEMQLIRIWGSSPVFFCVRVVAN
jgi:hypothetical protein